MPWDADTRRSPGVVAAMCASLKAVSKLDPRCPEVPKDDLLIGVAGVGDKVVIGADDGVDVDEIFRKGRLAGAADGHDPHSAVVSAGQARHHTFSPSVPHCLARQARSARIALGSRLFRRRSGTRSVSPRSSCRHHAGARSVPDAVAGQARSARIALGSRLFRRPAPGRRACPPAPPQHAGARSVPDASRGEARSAGAIALGSRLFRRRSGTKSASPAPPREHAGARLCADCLARQARSRRGSRLRAAGSSSLRDEAGVSLAPPQHAGAIRADVGLPSFARGWIAGAAYFVVAPGRRACPPAPPQHAGARTPCLIASARCVRSV